MFGGKVRANTIFMINDAQKEIVRRSIDSKWFSTCPGLVPTGTNIANTANGGKWDDAGVTEGRMLRFRESKAYRRLSAEANVLLTIRTTDEPNPFLSPRIWMV